MVDLQARRLLVAGLRPIAHTHRSGHTIGPLPSCATAPPTPDYDVTMALTRERITFMPSLRLLPDLEESIRQIPGVRAVSVVTDAQAQPTEVHVLAAPGKPAKQVVRDVQSLAMAQFDIDLDHRIVSVVQIEDESVSDEDDDADGSVVDLSDAAR